MKTIESWTEGAWFYIFGINPEPWTAPEFSAGRKGGKIRPLVYKSPGLAAYQEAIQEDLRANYPDVEPMPGEVEVNFFLWRQLPDYQGDRGRVRKHQADSTNMQKALEDAIQGILIENDRNVQTIRTTIMEQDFDTEPRIVIHVARMHERPRWVQEKADTVALSRAVRRHPSSEGRNYESGVDDLF